MKRAFQSALLLVMLAAGTGLPALALAVDDEAAERLRHRLEVRIDADAQASAPVDPAGPLFRFYQEQDYRPAWTRDGELLDHAERLRAAIRDSYFHGLHPEAYGLDSLTERLRDWPENPTAQQVADLDLVLSRSWLRLAEDAYTGQLNPDVVAPDWELRPAPTEELVAALVDGLLGDVGDALARLYPDAPEYARLRTALGHYRALALAGHYPRLEVGPTLRRGDEDPRVVALREQLVLLGDMEVPAFAGEAYFDGDLEEAVRRFQQRHGLAADGAVGPATRARLNVSPEARAEQLRINLERWRWMPRELGERHIRVNIAGFSMQAFESGEPVINQRVVVGRDYRRTPVFTGNMTYLVLSPSWEVPPRLAVRDILPEIQRNPDHLEQKGFQVLRGWGAEEEPVDPETVDWASLSRHHFPYRLRQKPGPQNAMGQVKYMFPNRHNVYLHDTPARELFKRPARAFSSGCIRVEDPDALTAWLLADHPAWDGEAVRRVLDEGRERTVSLRRGVPVHLQYWTAWADEEGVIHFRDDLYDRDPAVAAALAAVAELKTALGIGPLRPGSRG